MNCPLCGDERVSTKWEKNSIGISVCGKCSHLFSPVEQVISVRGTDSQFYSADYFSGRAGSGYLSYEQTQSSLKANAARLSRRILAESASRECLLEVGCGAGHFLGETANAFNSLYGIEICNEICPESLPANVKIIPKPAELVTVDDLPIRPTVIVMWDVVEHFANPLRTLQILSGLASENCDLFLSTGNVASLFAHLCGREWRLLTPLEHYSFFTPSTISFLLEKVGFKVESITSAWKWVPLCLIAHQMERILKIKNRISRFVPPGWRIPLSLGDVMIVHARRGAAD